MRMGRLLSSTAARCTASRGRMTICSTSATDRATACRFLSPTAPSSKRCSLPRTRWHRDPTWEIAFSREPEQRFIYLTDGQNERVRIVRRDTMTELLRSAAAGASRVHSIAVDSKQHLHDRGLTRVNAFRNSSSRASATPESLLRIHEGGHRSGLRPQPQAAQKLAGAGQEHPAQAHEVSDQERRLAVRMPLINGRSRLGSTDLITEPTAKLTRWSDKPIARRLRLRWNRPTPNG